MRRLVLIIFCMMLLVAFAGCGSGGDKSTTIQADNGIDEYIGNTSSKVFHRENCVLVSSIPMQYRFWFKTRTEAINAGYKACQTCSP